ncbi:MAG TPA: hypothetical protein VEW91_08370 [bacterium]|nr:hypothetical protein [bacterium]
MAATAAETRTTGVTIKGEIVGTFLFVTSPALGFLRAPDGSFTNIDFEALFAVFEGV